MKILLVGVVAVMVGVGAGTGVTAMRVKSEILQARADSMARADSLEAMTEESGAVEVTDQAEDHGAVPVEMALEEGQADTAGAPELRDVDQADPVAEDDTSHAAPDDPEQKGGAEGSGDGALPVNPMERDASASSPDTGTDGSPASTVTEEGSKKLAKVFTAMKPKDAAAVLQEMNDDEVKSILLHLSDRRAAQILGSFQPDRAALLSRAILMDRSAGS